MIVVRVELHSAVTGGTLNRRNYGLRVLCGRSTTQLDRREVQRRGELRAWPSEQLHIWNLVAAALARLGYGDTTASKQSVLPLANGG